MCCQNMYDSIVPLETLTPRLYQLAHIYLLTFSTTIHHRARGVMVAQLIYITKSCRNWRSIRNLSGIADRSLGL